MTRPAQEPEAPEPPRREIVLRPADLPFFYILLALHAATLVALPVGAWVLAPLVRRLVALERLPSLAGPLMVIALTALEVVLALRARAIWRRLRRAPRGR